MDEDSSARNFSTLVAGLRRLRGRAHSRYGQHSCSAPTASSQSLTQAATSPQPPVSTPEKPSSAEITIRAVPVSSPTSTHTPVSTHRPKPAPTYTVVPTNTPTPNAITHRSLAAESGVAYVGGTEEIVLRINGNDITNAEFVVNISRANTQLWSLRDIVARATPDDRWTPIPLHDQHRGPIPDNIAHQYEPLVAVMEKHDQESIALGVLLLEYARFSKAVEADHLPSERAVTEFVQRMRQSHEQNATSTAWGFTAEVVGQIEVMGADRFWSEIYRPRATRRLGERQLGGNSHYRLQRWRRHKRY